MKPQIRKFEFRLATTAEVEVGPSWGYAVTFYRHIACQTHTTKMRVSLAVLLVAGVVGGRHRGAHPSHQPGRDRFEHTSEQRSQRNILRPGARGPHTTYPLPPERAPRVLSEVTGEHAQRTR